MDDRMAVVESCDSWAPARNALRAVAHEASEWAGIPMPIQDQRMVVDPSYPFAELVANMTAGDGETDPEDIKVRNVFYSRRWRCDVAIWEEDGKVRHGKIPAFHGLGHQLSTLGASVAWGIEQEARALQTLGTMVRHHTFKHYLLTGAFLERSERSGITYMFRKLRPTVALTPNEAGDNMRILCALCLHPIAYYADSWAGAMCPTDDVIAHLALMRGDEPMFWRRANQHPPHRPESGL